MAEASKAADRLQSLAGRRAAGPHIEIAPAEPAFRLSLRAPEKSLAALSRALGVSLPRKPKCAAASGTRAALWLGPDEWLIIDTGKNNPADALASSRVSHSAVDVSHRNTAVIVSGPGAETALSAGCPQDLDRRKFPVGACSRTIFGKAEVVLWRTGEDAFRVECWRSLSPYVFDFLEEAARDTAH
ncbi:MAG: sarcosine oxidase subunit gamma [Rhizobiaceae bacterium]